MADSWSLSWHHDALGIADLWRNNITGLGVTVALLDTGLARPSGLDRASFQYFDARGNAVTAFDSHGHGTCCASVIAGCRGGALGIAPNVRIVSYRVLETGNATADIEAALTHILQSRPDIDILSCSFIVSNAPASLKAAVRALANDGRLVMAAAGDRASLDTDFPELTQDAITVAAVDRQMQPLAGAKTGPWIDISVPGQDIPAVAPNPDRVVMFGESSAAAAVATGIAALALSTRPAGPARKRLALNIEGLLKTTAVRPPAADSNAIGAGVASPAGLVKAAAEVP